MDNYLTNLSKTINIDLIILSKSLKQTLRKSKLNIDGFFLNIFDNFSKI